MSVKRAVVVALAASLAVPPAALAKTRKELEQEAQQKADDAKKAQEASQAQHAGGTPAPLGDAQRNAIGELWARNQLSAQAGTLAAAKGKSPEVKNLGKVLADDARRVSHDLGSALQQRGTDPAKLPPGQDAQRIQDELGGLFKASADDFDRAFVDFLTRNGPPLKEAAGRARDATPGSDADLKWYLDQVERLEIAHRDAARQLASQRQARAAPTPAPARPPGR